MSKQPISPSQTAQAVQNFSLRTSIQSLCKQWKQLKTSVVTSDVYKTSEQTYQMFGREVCNPVNEAWRQTYKQLPEQTTKLKFNYLNDYSFKERLVLLNVLAIGSALITFRRVNMYNAWGTGFRALRNASLAYIVGGLMVAPQIYNPLMNSK